MELLELNKKGSNSGLPYIHGLPVRHSHWGQLDWDLRSKSLSSLLLDLGQVM